MVEVFFYQKVLIIDAKPLPEVSKHQRAVLFELEMARHVLPVCTQKSEKHNEEFMNAIQCVLLLLYA